MPPKLLNYPLAIRDTYRDRAKYGGCTYLIHFTDGSTAMDADGNPLLFSHEECHALSTKSIADVIAARPGVYAKLAPIDPPKRTRKSE